MRERIFKDNTPVFLGDVEFRERRQRRTRQHRRRSVAFLVVLGMMSIPAAVATPWKVGTNVTEGAANIVADTEYIGVNRATSKYVSTYTTTTAPYMNDLNVDGGDKNVSTPSALKGSQFVVSPLKSIHFRADDSDWYAYIFPTGQGQRAADSVMKASYFWGTWDGFSGALTKYVYGDVVLFVSADHVVGTDTMEAMVKSIAPNCSATTTNDWRGNDWKRNRVFASADFQELQSAMTVGGSESVVSELGALETVVDTEDNTTILPKAVVEKINSSASSGKVGNEPDYPDTEPTAPTRPSLTTTVGIIEPDNYGPGCGWDYTLSSGRTEESDYASINERNEDAVSSAQKSIDSKITEYMESYSDYSKKWNEWKETRDKWLEFQNAVIDNYNEHPASVVPALSDILNGSIYPNGNPYNMGVE